MRSLLAFQLELLDHSHALLVRHSLLQQQPTLSLTAMQAAGYWPHAVQYAAAPHFVDPYLQQAMMAQAHAAQSDAATPHMASIASGAAFAAESIDAAAQSVAEDPDARGTPATHGYAMLIGERFRHVLREKELKLGRYMSGAAPIPGTLGVSDAKNISRVHATLQFEPDFIAPLASVPASSSSSSSSVFSGPAEGAWVVTCCGKNGMHHQGIFIALHGKFAVRHKDRMQIGDTPFYFLEPQHMSHDQIRT